MDETQHYLTEPLISYINEVDKDLEEELVTENDELVNDDDNIYSDSSELHIDDLFQDCDMVQSKVDTYAKHHGFVANKIYKNLDPVDKSIVQRRDFKYWKSGKISFYLAKRTGKIHLTKFINNHNRQCDTKTIELAPKYLRFSQSILDKIEHYTLNGRLGTG
ncbi:hypothetical protein RclHR1_17880004 [Rhizophagus clarus]|uniref:FAR1 domain-containing protein n=1 Tax=Rhizophagus clarus TaxID=94130 RepID=A0A2Z6QYC9_9GLOM|nr:hypothetical protein RclHR1_17880004 [Rhizophagus clarus]GES95191.1 hypothetical protein RCL_jg19381.t1 [Rhizophagus clarus]